MAYDPADKFAPILGPGEVQVVSDRQCDSCLHRSSAPGYPSCDAFDAIPLPILTGEHDHRHRFPGDDGILFAQDPSKASHFDAPPLSSIERLM